MARLDWSSRRLRAATIRAIENISRDRITPSSRLASYLWDDVAQRMRAWGIESATANAVKHGYYEHIKPERVEDLAPAKQVARQVAEKHGVAADVVAAAMSDTIEEGLLPCYAGMNSSVSYLDAALALQSAGVIDLTRTTNTTITLPVHGQVSIAQAVEMLVTSSAMLLHEGRLLAVDDARR